MVEHRRSQVTTPVDTGQKQDTRFKRGQSGNPSGRPKGSRNRISETFLNALADDFDQHGTTVIERVRVERPHDYLKVVVAVLPKEMSLGISTQQRRVEELSDEELTAIIRDTQQVLAGLESDDG